MTVEPRMRRWVDARDDSRWDVVFAPGVEEDPPPVRHLRGGLIFRGEGGRFRAPAVYGSDLEDLTDVDLQGLLDQARQRKETEHGSSGWGAARAREAEPAGGEGEAG